MDLKLARSRITSYTIGVCLFVFLAIVILDWFEFVSRSQAIALLGISHRGLAQRGWWFQLMTAPLVHASVTHLAFNMLTLWMLGPNVEQVLGRRRYLVFSVACAASAMLGFLLWNWGSGVVGCGYSGVIFGILAAQACYFPNHVLYVYAFFPLRMKYAVILLAAAEFFLLVSPERMGIAHVAHVFGAMGGWFYLWMSGVPRNGFRAATTTPTDRGNASPPRNRSHIPWEL